MPHPFAQPPLMLAVSVKWEFSFSSLIAVIPLHCPFRYLELQIHGELQFARDVAMLVVHKDEVSVETNPWIKEFRKRFGCKVMMFQGSIMKSF